MPERRKTFPSHKTSISAGTAGAGGGTLLVALANGLPDSSSLRDWLLLSAPTVALITSAAVAAGIFQYRSWIRERLVSRAIRSAKEAIAEGLANPQTSDEHKARLRKALENIERMEIDDKVRDAKRIISSEEFLPNRKVQTAS